MSPRLFQALTYFQPAVPWHVNIENDQIGLLLRNLLQRGRAVVDRNDFVSRIREDFPPHILGGHAVVGEQYLPGQRFSSEEGR